MKSEIEVSCMLSIDKGTTERKGIRMIGKCLVTAGGLMLMASMLTAADRFDGLGALPYDTPIRLVAKKVIDIPDVVRLCDGPREFRGRFVSETNDTITVAALHSDAIVTAPLPGVTLRGRFVNLDPPYVVIRSNSAEQSMEALSIDAALEHTNRIPIEALERIEADANGAWVSPRFFGVVMKRAASSEAFLLEITRLVQEDAGATVMAVRLGKIGARATSLPPSTASMNSDKPAKTTRFVLAQPLQEYEGYVTDIRDDAIDLKLKRKDAQVTIPISSAVAVKIERGSWIPLRSPRVSPPAAPPVASQTPPALTGEHVRVTLANNSGRHEGRISSWDCEGLSLRVAGTRDLMRVPWSSVARLERQEPRLTRTQQSLLGMLVGAAAGGAGFWVKNRSQSGSSDSQCRPSDWVCNTYDRKKDPFTDTDPGSAFASGAFGGAIVGATTDDAIPNRAVRWIPVTPLPHQSCGAAEYP